MEEGGLTGEIGMFDEPAYVTLESQHDTTSLSGHFAAEGTPATGESGRIEPLKEKLTTSVGNPVSSGKGAEARPPSIEYIRNEFKIRVKFNPWELRNRGMSDPYLSVPMKFVINPRWKYEKDELGVTDDSRVGGLILKGFNTDYFQPVSGRMSIIDKRNDIGTEFGGETVHPDRLGADGSAKGANMRIQFTVTDSPRTSDTKVLLRPSQTEHSVSYLEKTGNGHLSKKDLWDLVQTPPGTITEKNKNHRVTHINTPLGAYMLKMLKEKNIKPVFQDKNEEVLFMLEEDARRNIDKLMLDRYKSLTVGEMVDNGSLVFCNTHADMDALAASADEFASPWGDAGAEVNSIKDDDLRKVETQNKLDRDYFIDMTLEAEIQPTTY